MYHTRSRKRQRSTGEQTPVDRPVRMRANVQRRTQARVVEPAITADVVALRRFMAYLDSLHDFCGSRADLLTADYVISLCKRIFGYSHTVGDVANMIMRQIGVDVGTNPDLKMTIERLLDYKSHREPTFERTILSFIKQYKTLKGSPVSEKEYEVLKVFNKNCKRPTGVDLECSKIRTFLNSEYSTVDTNMLNMNAVCKMNRVLKTVASYWDSDGNRVEYTGCDQPDTVMNVMYELTRENGDVIAYNRIGIHDDAIKLTMGDQVRQESFANFAEYRGMNVRSYAAFIGNQELNAKLQSLLGIQATDNLQTKAAKIFDVKRSGDWLQVEATNRIAHDRSYPGGCILHTIDIPCVARAIATGTNIVLHTQASSPHAVKLIQYGDRAFTTEEIGTMKRELRNLRNDIDAVRRIKREDMEDAVEAYGLSVNTLIISWKAHQLQNYREQIILEGGNNVKRYDVFVSMVWQEFIGYATYVHCWLHKFFIERSARDSLRDVLIDDRLFGTDTAPNDLLEAKNIVYKRLMDEYVPDISMFQGATTAKIIDDVKSATELIDSISFSELLDPQKMETIIQKMARNLWSSTITRTLASIVHASLNEMAQTIVGTDRVRNLVLPPDLIPKYNRIVNTSREKFYYYACCVIALKMPNVPNRGAYMQKFARFVQETKKDVGGQTRGTSRGRYTSAQLDSLLKQSVKYMMTVVRRVNGQNVRFNNIDRVISAYKKTATQSSLKALRNRLMKIDPIMRAYSDQVLVGIPGTDMHVTRKGIVEQIQSVLEEPEEVPTRKRKRGGAAVDYDTWTDVYSIADLLMRELYADSEATGITFMVDVIGAIAFSIEDEDGGDVQAREPALDEELPINDDIVNRIMYIWYSGWQPTIQSLPLPVRGSPGVRRGDMSPTTSSDDGDVRMRSTRSPGTPSDR